MTNQILLTNEFDINSVSFTKPRKNNMGGQNILINYNQGTNNTPLIFQTPRLRAPFGLDRQDNDGVGPVKYNINVSLAHGENPGPNVQAFTDNIGCLDNFVKTKGTELSESWFGKQKSAEVVNELFKPCERKSKDDKWASTLRLKLPIRDGKPTFAAYGQDKNELDVMTQDGEISPDFIQRGCEVVAIIQCTGVWFIGKTQFGIGWKVLQVKIFQTNKLVGYSIVDEEDVEEEEDDEVE
jgi:hypothetical protein